MYFFSLLSFLSTADVFNSDTLCFSFSRVNTLYLSLFSPCLKWTCHSGWPMASTVSRGWLETRRKSLDALKLSSLYTQIKIQLIDTIHTIYNAFIGQKGFVRLVIWQSMRSVRQWYRLETCWFWELANIDIQSL